MSKFLVLTIIADDKPGIVETLSATIAAQNGNWLESRLTKLAGKFAGFVQVSIASDNIPALQSELAALSNQGISVLIQENDSDNVTQSEKHIKLTIIGLDRPGIVKELSSAFVSHQLNVVDMHSFTESAAMSAEELFKAEVDLAVQTGIDQDKFNEEIEAICNELDLDWTLTEK